MSSRPYNRVLLKISGDCFADPALLGRIVAQVSLASASRIRVAIVMGGGNILRGRDARELDQVTADKAGMLATVINGLRLAALQAKETRVRHLSTVAIPGTVQGYDPWTARAALASGDVLVLSGGTGNPFFSTDSAAALRAAELGMQIILKGTRVSGVYSKDPKKYADAKLYRTLSYEQALAEKLKVMDLTAFALCMERRIPIRVFDITRPGTIIQAIQGKQIGSIVC